MKSTDYFYIYTDGQPHKVKLVLAKYLETDRPALMMVDDQGMPYAKLSTNVPSEPLEDGEIIIKTYSENDGLYGQIKDFVIDTGKEVDMIHTQCPIVKIREEMFK